MQSRRPGAGRVAGGCWPTIQHQQLSSQGSAERRFESSQRPLASDRSIAIPMGKASSRPGSLACRQCFWKGAKFSLMASFDRSGPFKRWGVSFHEAPHMRLPLVFLALQSGGFKYLWGKDTWRLLLGGRKGFFHVVVFLASRLVSPLAGSSLDAQICSTSSWRHPCLISVRVQPCSIACTVSTRTADRGRARACLQRGWFHPLQRHVLYAHAGRLDSSPAEEPGRVGEREDQGRVSRSGGSGLDEVCRVFPDHKRRSQHDSLLSFSPPDRNAHVPSLHDTER